MDSVIKKDFILKELRYAIKNDDSSCSYYKVKQFITNSFLKQDDKE